jgi:HK97 family phage prohead protease|nr:MAG TPA: prohead serine protease [Caudoviricetes sp.]
MDREMRQIRGTESKFKTRANEETGDMYISGYFSVFNSNYEIWAGGSESIDPAAFDETLEEDIRCLIDHKSRLVLGRNTAGTLELRTDDTGLWGEVKINPKDQDAVNLYERVKRGDVNQCSIGFDILEEEFTENKETGAVHWTIKKVKLYEVSVVTFPAYEDTGVSARQKQAEEIKKRQQEKWRADLKARMKGV